MDWSHYPQASRQHYTTSLNLESRREKEKEDDREIRGAAIKRGQRNGKQLETIGETGCGPADLSWRPMSQDGI